MALNLSPEPGVKLTKKDRAHLLKKMKQGWKATCLIPDYVFDENYKLLPIEKVKCFIDENGHLPDIPSECNVLNNGYDMVEMDGILLKKIEELTLYTIELNAIVKRQQEIIESLQSK